jgi:hypothetical protein
MVLDPNYNRRLGLTPTDLPCLIEKLPSYSRPNLRFRAGDLHSREAKGLIYPVEAPVTWPPLPSEEALDEQLGVHTHTPLSAWASTGTSRGARHTRVFSCTTRWNWWVIQHYS